jgi:hypothetical protein
MRASLKTTIVASLAALTLVAGAVSADAKPMKMMGGGHHHFGPGLAFGVIGAGIAAAAYANSCTVYQPVYDPYGNYLGQQPVNTCQ